MDMVFAYCIIFIYTDVDRASLRVLWFEDRSTNIDRFCFCIILFSESHLAYLNFAFLYINMILFFLLVNNLGSVSTRTFCSNLKFNIPKFPNFPFCLSSVGTRSHALLAHIIPFHKGCTPNSKTVERK